MTNYETVNILGQDYKIGPLNYAVIRKLGRLWKLEKVSDVEEKITKAMLSFSDAKSLSFTAIDTFAEVLLMLLQTYNESVEIADTDAFMNFLMYEHPETFEKIVKQFSDDMQTPETPKQLQVVAKKKPEKPVPPKNRKI